MHHAKTQGLRTLPVVLFSIASGVSFAATHDHSVDLDSLSLAEGLSASVAPAHEGREIELRPAASFGLAMGQLSGFLSMGSNSETNSVQELHARVWSSLAGTSAMAVLLQNGLNELEASHGVDTSFMKKLQKLFFTLIAFLGYNMVYAQELLDKMKNAQTETRSAAYESAVVIFGYADIAVGLILVGWAIASFRASRQASEDGSGEDFSWVKFILPKAAVIAIYMIIRIVALNILS
jgi:hypothetical protein